MKVELRSIYCTESVQAGPGAIIDVSADEGQQLVEGGFAVAVTQQEAKSAAKPATNKRTGK